MHDTAQGLPHRLVACADTLKDLARGGWWPAIDAMATAERLERLADDLAAIGAPSGD